MLPNLPLLALLAASISSPAQAQRLDVIHPVIPLALSDPNPFAGEVVLVTIGLSEQATQVGALKITTTTESNWLLIPRSATYAPGDSSVTFSATIAPGATGAIEISASENGVQVDFTQSLQSILSPAHS